MTYRLFAYGFQGLQIVDLQYKNECPEAARQVSHQEDQINNDYPNI